MDSAIRLRSEENERRILSPKACLAAESRGRLRPEPACEIRTCFQRDRDRIIHCRSFRRLKHKTQVFLAPSGDHYPPDPHFRGGANRPHHCPCVAAE